MPYSITEVINFWRQEWDGRLRHIHPIATHYPPRKRQGLLDRQILVQQLGTENFRAGVGVCGLYHSIHYSEQLQLSLIPQSSYALPHAQSCWTLCDPMGYRHQAPLSTGFSRQEYWSGLPFTPPGNLPDPGIQPGSPALAGRFFTAKPFQKPHFPNAHMHICSL